MIKIFICILALSFQLSASNVFAARYFAEIESDIVKRVIVADSAEWCSMNLGGTWIETFMDKEDDSVGPKSYAGKGYKYLSTRKDFQSPKPFPSSVEDVKGKWKAPIDVPKDGKRYKWDESTVSWQVWIID